LIRAIVDLPFALAQRVGLPPQVRTLEGVVRALPGIWRESEVLRKPFICRPCQHAERLPVFTSRSVSDSNQNHFIPFAELIRV